MRLSKEHRAKISQSKIGHTTSLATKIKISQAQKKRFESPAVKRIYSQAQKKRFESPQERTKISLTQKSQCESPKVREQLRQQFLGRQHTMESRIKMSQAQKKRYESPEARNKMGQIQLGKTFTLEARAKMSQAGIKRYESPNERAKISLAQKEYWEDLLPDKKNELVRNSLLACQIKPNKAETSLMQLLNTVYPKEWKYVGNGEVIIGGKNPDYININGKKLFIELFGNYWHKGEDPRVRMEYFRQYGYSTLIIWERELQKPEKVLCKIVRFVNGVGH